MVFLASPKATAGVFFSVPLSVLATLIILSVGGSSINTMLLGGFALAFSRLIDNSVVVLENIFRHMEEGMPPREAAGRGASEVASPVLAATLTTAIVFFPVTLLHGVSQFLFTELGLSVVLALFSSYVVAMTVVPLFCAHFIQIKPHTHIHGSFKGSWSERFGHWFNARFEHVLVAYDNMVGIVLRKPKFWLSTLLIGCLAFGLFESLVGLAYFPRTDSGQFVLNLKAPTGTRIEMTARYVARIEDIVRHVVAKDDLNVIVSNIGETPGFSSLYTTNTGSHSAFVQVSLKAGHKIGSYAYMDRVREAVRNALPELRTYFQSGGLVDAVLNLGLPAPLDIQVTGSDMDQSYATALALQKKIAALSDASQAYIPQDIDAPSFRVTIDRLHAKQLGLSERDVAGNLITAVTSNAMIAPGYWIDPRNGNQYFLSVQYPENRIAALDDLRSVPLRAPSDDGRMVLLDAVASIMPTLAPTVVSHYQLGRVIDLYVAPKEENLRALSTKVNDIIAGTPLPEGTRVVVHGSVLAMWDALARFSIGLLLAVLLVYLILVAQFRSFIDPLIIVLAVPPGLTGVILTLILTGTTLNVMSLMGIVMMVGIVVSNSILIVEFAHRLLETREPEAGKAVAVACRLRLRPILMTSFATIIGLIPMSLGLNAGSEAYAPLARVLIGGLSFSLLVTVFIVPAAFVLVHGKKNAAFT